MPTLREEKKKFTFPSSPLVLFIIVILVAILTYIVPAGQYQYVTDASGNSIVDPTSFQYVEQNPLNPFRVFVAIQEGFIDGAQIIFLILAGYFWVYSVMRSGAFTAMIHTLLSGSGKRNKMIIPICILIFALAGSTYGEMETVYGLIPIFVTLAIALGYDALVGVCMCMGAVAVGFASATTNPFTIGIAQSYANLPMFSGLAYRWIIFAAFVGTYIMFVMWYAARIKKNPERGLLYGLDFSAFQVDLEQREKFTTTHKIVLLGMVVTILVIIYGSLNLGWYINEMAGLFIISAILTGIVVRRTAEEIVQDCIVSIQEMAGAVVVVGLSRTILVIMSQGMIIDTVIYALSTLLNGLPTWATAEMMLVAQNIINFFIPSGSGQAAAIMPIMVPLADLTGVNRQIAVLAYQFGDGYSNLLWPTAACTVMCGIAKVPLGKWYRFFLPLFGIMFVLQMFFIFVATLINYS